MVFQDITKQVSVMDHTSDVKELCAILQPFHVNRESTYRMSFAKRGEVGIWMNLARKYDRIDGLMEQIGKAKIQDIYITLIDTLVDLALYSLKWLAIIRRFEPESFGIWMSKNGVVENCKKGDDYKDSVSVLVSDKLIEDINRIMLVRGNRFPDKPGIGNS